MNRLVIGGLCAAALIATSGCDTLQSMLSTGNTDQQALANFTTADLQAAIADATANDDQTALMCYNALLPIARAQETAGAVPVGAISTFQRGRDGVQLLKGSSPVKLACAPLAIDVQGDTLSLTTLIPGL